MKKELPDDVVSRLPNGMFRFGNKLYAQCKECGSVVRINKPIIGSLHLCTDSSVTPSITKAEDDPRS